MVTSAAPLPTVYPTVIHMLAAAAVAAPDAEALALDDRRLNYRDYAACVAGFAVEFPRRAAFVDRGVGAFRLACTTVDAFVRNHYCHAFSIFDPLQIQKYIIIRKTAASPEKFSNDDD